MIVIATGNHHKVEEIRAILGDGFRFQTLEDFPAAPKTIEDAPTFSGNATKKAVELARHISADSRFTAHDSRTYVLADDSGLEIDALNGAPGVHSARFAADDKVSGNAPDAANCEKLLRLLKDVPLEKRTARFRCVIALVSTNTQSATANPQLFDGACEGKIIFAQRGNNGFGYDPLFVPDGFDQTFAELGGEIKNQISHRSKALIELRRRFQSAN